MSDESKRGTKTPKQDRGKRNRSRSTPQKTLQGEGACSHLGSIRYCSWYLEEAGKTIPVVIMDSSKNGENIAWTSKVMSAANDLFSDANKWSEACSVVDVSASPFKFEVSAYRSKRDDSIWFAGSAGNKGDRDRAAALAALVAHQKSLPTWCGSELRALVEKLLAVEAGTRCYPEGLESAERAEELQSLRQRIPSLQKDNEEKSQEIQSLKQTIVQAQRREEEVDKDFELAGARYEENQKTLQVRIQNAREELWNSAFQNAKLLISLDRAKLRDIETQLRTQEGTEENRPYQFATCLNTLESNVFIGEIGAATDFKFLKKERIKSILNVSGDQLKDERSAYNECGIDTLHLRLKDHPLRDIVQVLRQAHEFIDAALLKNKRVLVHCRAGRNRAAAIIVSYIMRTRCRTTPSLWKHPMQALSLFWDALGEVATQRYPILMQQSFRFQLVLWALHRFEAEQVPRDRVWLALRCHCCILSTLREELSAADKQLGNDVILQYADRLTEKSRRSYVRTKDAQEQEQINQLQKQILRIVKRYLSQKDSAYSSSEDFSQEG